MHSASHVRAAEASITGASSCWHAGCTHHMPHRQPHSGAAMRACASSRTRVLRRQAGSLQRRAMSPSIQHSRVASSTTQVAARADDSLSDAIQLPTCQEDTIAAVVTGSISQGAVSIIRLSGAAALDVAASVFRQQSGKPYPRWPPPSHTVHYGTAVDAEGRAIDEVLLLVMLSPRSYTREDVVEIHTHGGGVCAARVLQACIEAGARRARPGEFTLRAFLNGRLDLSQVEALGSLLTARTSAAADSALAGLRGGLGELVVALRRRTLALIAEIEARIDFDEDLPSIDSERMQIQVEELQQDIETALRTARQGSLLRQGLTAAIVGRPNVGKSSLLNVWSRTERAIVTEIAGTTRDVLEAGLVVGGVQVTLLDTAGIRESSDVVERLGVQRSREAAAEADVVVMVVDAQVGWTDADGAIFSALWGSGPGSRSCLVKGLSLLVVNKTDLLVPSPSSGNGQAVGDVAAAPPAPSISLPLVCQGAFQKVVHTSASTGTGMQGLNQALLELAGAPGLAQGGASWAVNERQAEALVRAHQAFSKVAESMADGLPIDFWTIDLRSALISLGEVSGDDVTEEVLDSVFSSFCIGK